MAINGMFSYGHTYQRFIRGCAIPVMNIWRRYNNITFFYGAFFSAFFLIISFAVKNQKSLLNIRMIMPVIATSRIKYKMSNHRVSTAF